MGDFNAVPDSDEIRWLTGMTRWAGGASPTRTPGSALSRRRRSPGYTWARANPYIERMHWLRPDRRLDYIFVTPVRRDRRATVHARAASSSTSPADGRRRARVRLGPLRRHRRRADGGRVGPCDALSAAGCSGWRTSPIRTSAGFAGARPADFVASGRVGYAEPGRQPRAQAQDGAAGGAARRPARAGARPPGADRRSVERRRCRASGGRRWPGSTPAGVGAGRRSASSPGTTTPTSEVSSRRARSSGCSRLTRRSDLAPRAEAGDAPTTRSCRSASRLALIGVSSCVATGDLGAWGEIGEAQLGAARGDAAAPELAGKTRVVLIHHPPVHAEGRRAAQPPRPRRAWRRCSRAPAPTWCCTATTTRTSAPSSPGPGGGRSRHRRRLGVVRGRPRAPRPLQHLRDRRPADHLGDAAPTTRRPTPSAKSGARRWSSDRSPAAVRPRPAQRGEGKGEGRADHASIRTAA